MINPHEGGPCHKIAGAISKTVSSRKDMQAALIRVMGETL